MAARQKFVCAECASVSSKWSGRCEACGAWNSIAEAPSAAVPGGGAAAKGTASRVKFEALTGDMTPPPRLPTTIAEFDRALGGGLVVGSAILVGGDPGIGKSTLLLQAAAGVARAGHAVRYISGEEAVAQIRMRAARLGLARAPVDLAAVSDVRDIAAALEASPPALAIIDSIQTMWLDGESGAPGTVSQVRACSFELIKLAKTRGFSLVLVGHVTKEGAIAGPRVLEHMVDAVLYFEGDRGHQFRILRGVKNRFGATDEIGVFEMTGQGLAEVANPSALFLAERRGNVAGSAVFAGLEGTRPVLLEIQALLSPNAGGSARRSVIGWDSSRLSMLLAVMETRCGLKLSGHDVFLNVAGGLRITEPAADVAVAAALASALAGKPADPGAVHFGEVGLSGEVRQVAQAELRLREAQKLGFDLAVLPRRVARGNRPAQLVDGIRLQEIGHLAELTAGYQPA